ncbi:hypothetical protein PVAND_013085 [Polypedilum vanderplanki]|uniref:DNA polymerase eta n=1 Tax=Polypedilum vanderplanki TaxID=319348 RepID=A0A9J6CPB1_POLVA|nr:hypothetical protein PVAND_013085 [Polypedilum vanderplanki]
MDCFYCQVEELLDEKLRGQPIAVVQYVENAGIIAVNYKARAMGVTRHMREKEAKAVCSSLVCVKVPSKYNKADISKYKEAGKRVADVFEKFTKNLERASIDEAYLDITENVAARMLEMRQKKFSLQPHHLFNTYAVGYDNIGQFIKDVSSTVDINLESSDHETQALQSSKLRLLLGASIVSDIRKAVKEETGYECSAGIAMNKILAKLVCGMNKPNKQTLLPIDSIPKFFDTLDISKIKGMGGKIGEDVCKKLNVKKMNDLLVYQESELQKNFGARIGSFLYLIARGIDLEKVERKVMNKCIAVSKNFRGKNEICNVNSLKFWLKELSKQLKERLDLDHAENGRVAKQMTVQFTQHIENKDVSSSRVCQLNGGTVNSLSLDEIVQETFNTIERNTSKLLRIEGKCVLNNNIKNLGITVTKLEDQNAPSTNKIQNLLKNHAKKSPKVKASTSKRTRVSNVTENIENPKNDESNAYEVEKDQKIIQQYSNEDIFSEIDNQPSEFELVAGSEFFKDFIKGEKTLRHWLQQILIKLNEDIREKCSKEKVGPKNIQLLWRQLIGNDERNFAETIPLNIFTNNSIKVEFLYNVMNDSTKEFSTNEILNPISLIEIKAIDFETRHSEWNLTVEKSIYENEVVEENEETYSTENKEEEEEGKTQIEHDIVKHNIQGNSRENDIEMDLQNDIEPYLNNQETKQDNIDNDEDLKELENAYQSFSNEIDNPPLNNIEENLKTDSDQLNDTVIDIKTDDAKSMPCIKVKSAEELGVASTSYMQTYAEFQQNPIIDTLNPLEECLECGKMIRKFDMLTHIDGHIAMQISMSQREEYRAEQKRKLLNQTIVKSAKKSIDKATKSKINISSLSIEKFVKKPHQDENLEVSNEKELCLECNTLISKEDIITHQDYHFAQKLRMEQLKSTTITKKTPGTSKNKRPLTQNDNKKVKSLRAYFTE